MQLTRVAAKQHQIGDAMAAQNPPELDQLITELKSTAEEPRKIDEIPLQTVQWLFEEPVKALKGGDKQIYQGLKEYLSAHRKLEETLLKQHKSTGNSTPLAIQALEAIWEPNGKSPNMHKVYKRLVKEFQKRSRGYESFVEDIESLKRDPKPGGREGNGPADRKTY